MSPEISDTIDTALRSAATHLSPQSYGELDYGHVDSEARGIVRAALEALGSEFVLELALDAAIERLRELLTEGEYRGGLSDNPLHPNYRPRRRGRL